MRRDRCCRWLCRLAILVSFPAPTFAQPPEQGAEEPAPDADRPTVRAGVLSPDFRLDGRLDEAAWSAATDSIGSLITVEPEEEGVPEGQTTVKVLADPRAIVFGMRCHDPDAKGIVSFSKARDALLDEEDHVVIVLDPFLDGRSGYVFAVNPAGARFDGLVAARGEEANSDWDAIWEAKTARDEHGWYAEIRIPVTSLSFKAGQKTWGLNVQRRVQRLQETSRWSGAKQDYEVYQTSQAGVLTELPEFDLGLGLSVRTTALGVAKKPTDRSDVTTDGDLSLDVTQRLGANLLASLTVNTDFSETEVDVRRINLTRFDVSFPEKRTFFLSGADIFEFGLGIDPEILMPFFTRRIGLVGPGEEDQVAVPVDAGGKISGRIGETNFAALLVNTRKQNRLLVGDADTLDVPDASMGAVRIKQDIFEESAVGVLATFGDQMHRPESWSGGVDFTFQTSSFQDDKNLLFGLWGLRANRDSLVGEKLTPEERDAYRARDKYAYGARFEYPNDLVDFSISTMRIADGFNPSLGFVPRKGVQVFEVGAEVSPRPSWPLVRQMFYEVAFTQFRKRYTERWESYSMIIKPLDVLLESGDRFEISFEPQGDRIFPLQFEVFPDIDIPVGSYEWTRNVFALRAAEKRIVSGQIRWETGGFYTGTLRTTEATLALKPSSLFTIEFTGESNRARVKASEDESIQLFDKSFTQNLLGCRIELNVSPDLHLSSLTQYDSDSRELGSNTRLRWTFHPHGDLFVVYNHNAEFQLMKDSFFAPLRLKDWKFVSYQTPIKLQFTLQF